MEKLANKDISVVMIAGKEFASLLKAAKKCLEWEPTLILSTGDSKKWEVCRAELERAIDRVDKSQWQKVTNSDLIGT